MSGRIRSLLHRRPRVEELERRWVLSVTFVNGQELIHADDLWINDVEVGDLDGDGDADVLVNSSNASLVLWTNDGGGYFTSSESELDVTWPGISLGDLDGDDDLDIISDIVYFNDGNGDFINSGQSMGGNTLVELADLDTDGDLDAVVRPASGPSNWADVWLNDGSGKFTESTQLFDGDGPLKPIALGDVDSDGDVDAIVGRADRPDADFPRREAGHNEVWLNDGLGNFNDSGQRLGNWVWGANLGDLDGDNDLDVLVIRGFPEHFVWLNDGEGNFTGKDRQEDAVIEASEANIDELALSIGLVLANCDDIELADVDNDGDLDAVVAARKFGFLLDTVLLNDGNAVFRGIQLSTASTNVALGDFDGDGDFDAYMGRSRLNGWSNGTRWMTPRAERFFFNTLINAPGDANHDGLFNQLDIVQVLQAAKYLTGEPATWEEGDWNNDGVFDQADIIKALLAVTYLQGPAALTMGKGNDIQEATTDELLAEVDALFRV